MDSYRKNIQSLSLSLDEKRDSLSVFYRQFGARMLEDSVNPSRMAGALSEERTDSWRSLMSSRESDTCAVLEIRTAANRLQELLQFKKELEKTRMEDRTASMRSASVFGRFVLDHYSADPVSLDFIGEASRAALEKASLCRSEIAVLLEKQEQNQLENGDNGFIGKIFLQLKNTSLSSAIKQQQMRLEGLLTDALLPVLRDEGLTIRLRQLYPSGESAAALDKAAQSVQRERDLEERAVTLESDLAQVRETLKGYEAADNSSRRMDDLRTRIRETDRKIDSLTGLSAREYSDKFLDEDGRSLLGGSGDGSGFSDMGKYAHQLEQVSRYRMEISVIRRKIEILENSLKIDSLDKNIASFEKSVHEYERKIIHYQEMIQGLSSSIADAKKDRAVCIERKTGLEEELEKFPPVT